MKKVLALLLIAVMCCGVFAACSSPAAETPSEPTTTEETPATTEDADAASLVSDAFINPTADWTQYNDLITQIKTETDYAKRTELMHQAEDILMSNYCILPFYYYNDLYMQKDYVDGIYANLFQTKFFMYATMSNGSDTLRLNLASEPDFLDPALNSTVDGACLAANSFSGLYTYNAEGHTVPACATGYTVSDDGLTYTVTLREGLKWSDGSDLTAADFEYAWKRAAATATAADYGYMFAGFAGYPDELNVTAKDATTFEFVLTAPCAYIEDLMAFPTFYPVKQAAVEAYKDWQTSPGGWCQDAGFVSNGAYVCTEWNHDTSMTYEKNPYWYDADKVTVIYGFEQDGTVRNYAVMKQMETPGLGAKMQDWFRDPTGKRSVIGRNPGSENMTVTKDGGTVDAITAATISSRAFLKTLNDAFTAYQNIQAEEKGGQQ